MTSLITHENPRVRAYARATGIEQIDYRFREWINARMAEAAEQGAGAFRFEDGGPPHISDHAAFTAFCERRAAEQMLRARGWSEGDVDAAYGTYADPDLDPDRWLFVAEAFEAQGPEGNGHDLPTCRACGHPGSDDHEDCPNCAEVPA